MRREFSFALLFLLPAPFAATQQPAATISDQTRVYHDESGVTAPILTYSSPENPHGGVFKKDLYGLAVFSAVVDVNGVPHEFHLVRPPGHGLDTLASTVVDSDRFSPGTYRGTPVNAAIFIEVGLPAYKDTEKDGNGQKVETFHLKSPPTQIVELQPPPPVALVNVPRQPTVTLADGSYINPDGAKTTAPRVIRSVEASFSNEARMARVQGVCLVSLIVDPHGMPQQLHLARSLTPSMDQKAFEAIEQYRFQPAMKNGVPVPVVITIEVDFRLY